MRRPTNNFTVDFVDGLAEAGKFGPVRANPRECREGRRTLSGGAPLKPCPVCRPVAVAIVAFADSQTAAFSRGTNRCPDADSQMSVAAPFVNRLGHVQRLRKAAISR